MSRPREGQPTELREAAGPSLDDPAFLVLIRSGDKQAFTKLVALLRGRMLALARSFCAKPELAEEVVQDTWLAVIQGLDRFEGRAPLRAWIFSILVRRAKSTAVREKRHIQLSESDFEYVQDGDGLDREPGMGSRGRWSELPVPWGYRDPEAAMMSRETLAFVEAALETLPKAQRAAVLLRDVEGLDTEEACNVLEVSETYLRVLLFRGRSTLRRALDKRSRENAPARSSGAAARKESP